MQLINAPTKIVLPFANAGGKNTIPVPSQIGITGGAASFTDGFPPLTRTPVASGGIPPSGLDMNGILYDVSALVLWANAGANYPWDSSFATNANILGYPSGANVLRSDNKGFWYNLTDGNQVSPEASGTAAVAAGWVPGSSSGIAAVTMTNANVTMTPLQYGLPIISITGTLTGNLQLIFPSIPGNWQVVNSTTGAFTITAKTAAGTGALVTQSVVQQVVGDGTNIYGVTAANTSLGGVVGDTRKLTASLTSAGVSLTFTADEILVALALGGATTTLSSYSQTLNISTTGANGMDTGAAPVSGYVAAYAISGTSGISIVGVNASSGVVPTIYGNGHMPAGYTNSALIGVWPTNGSSQFVAGYQIDRNITIASVTVLNTTTQAGSYTSLSVAGAVPFNARRCVGTLIFGDSVSSSNTRSMFIASDSNGIGQQTYSNGLTSSSGANGGSNFAELLLPTAQTVYYKASTSAGGSGTTFTFGITGYTI